LYCCQAEKQVGVPHPSKSIGGNKYGLIIIVDYSRFTWVFLFGPVAYISVGGNKYGLVIVVDYSHFTWIFFLHDKSVVQDTFKKFAKRA
jgi:mRNA-degrading endonuclease HigB of HigAB toxin-antitoxin module